MPVKPSNESADAYLRFRPYLDNTYEKKTQFWTTFFTNWLRGSPQKVVGLKKMGPTCCPTTRSTRINPRLGVPVEHEAPTVRQFWNILAVLQSPEVETLENFFRLW